MKCERIALQVTGSREDAALYTYIADYSDSLAFCCRPMVIVCPGGAYLDTSDREAEQVALQFCAMGYHAAVLRYSTAPDTRFPTALLELGSAVAYVRSHAEQWHVDTDKIAVLGFSAGGHLAASYCCFWNKDWVMEALGKPAELLRPNAMLLCYPVISSGEYAHTGSFKNLLGDRYEELKEQLSLEHQVSMDVPPAFVWHTFEDDGVPCQNSLLLVQALAERNISVEFHLFPKGPHGLSLANHLTQSTKANREEPSCACWIELLHAWLERWRQEA